MKWWCRIVLSLLAVSAAAQDKAAKSRIEQARRDYRDASDYNRQKALEQLYGLKEDEALRLLGAALVSDSSNKVRMAAARGLGMVSHRTAVEQLARGIDANKGRREVLLEIVGALASVDMRICVAPLVKMFELEHDVAAASVKALGKIGDPEAIPPLLDLLQDVEEESNKSNSMYYKGRYLRGNKDYDFIKLGTPIRDALAAITGQRLSKHKEWMQWWNACRADLRLIAVYECEATGKRFEVRPGAEKKCTLCLETTSGHRETLLKYRLDR